MHDKKLEKGLYVRLNLPEEPQYIYGAEALEKTGYVKWDREKVAGWLKSRMRAVKDRQVPFEELRPETKEAWFSVVDQLKQELDK